MAKRKKTKAAKRKKSKATADTAKGMYRERKGVKPTAEIGKAIAEWYTAPLDLDHIETQLRDMLRRGRVEVATDETARRGLHWVDLGDGWQCYHLRDSLTRDQRKAAKDAMYALELITKLRTCDARMTSKWAYTLGLVVGQLRTRRFEDMVRKQRNRGKKATKKRVSNKEQRYHEISDTFEAIHADLCDGKPDRRKRRSTQAVELTAEKLGWSTVTVYKALKWMREQK